MPVNKYDVTALADSKSTETAATATESTDEDKIPVLVNQKKAEASTSDSIYKILLMIVGVSLSGVGIYIYLKKVSKQINPKSSLMQIKVLTQHHFGPKRSIAVIRVAGESILVGITDHNINVLKTLSLLDDDIPDGTPQDFNKTVSEVKNESRNIVRNESTNEMTSNDDDFEFAGIRDMVTSKIKNFRRI
jgi:flagellar protein FliO/FliZ